MAKIWEKRIIARTQKYADCPAFLKKNVLALLKEDVKDGTITKEEFKELTGATYR